MHSSLDLTGEEAGRSIRGWLCLDSMARVVAILNEPLVLVQFNSYLELTIKRGSGCVADG
jgi:hypothetical protein